MEMKANNIIEANSLSVTTTNQVRPNNYSFILDRYVLNYKASDNYFEVGEADWIQGWIIDISVIPSQFESLLETIIPLLIDKKLVFKIARNFKIAQLILGGEKGLSLLGKVITIY